MDTVLAFNTELSGLYDIKPPISKAKMSSITRSAMKAIKFYKHVVQSVEKFIQKCRTEYKIPGIYVIDSIVRQSRHQFGADKDVFAPRFARNIQTTFVHLFKCPPDEKGRLIRVLNLWQKNNVFAPEVIQPLFDLADPNNPLHQQLSEQINESTNTNGMNVSGPAPTHHDESPAQEQLSMAMSSEMSNPGNPLDKNTIRQLQQLQQLLIIQTSVAGEPPKTSLPYWDRILGQDSEDEDDDKTKQQVLPHNQTILEENKVRELLKDPNVLQQLQTLQKLKLHEMMEEKQTKLNELRIQDEKFDKHLAHVLKKLPFANECDLGRQPPIEMQGNNDRKYGMSAAAMTTITNYMQSTNMSGMNDPNEPEVEFIADEGKVEVINLDGNDSRSPSPDRDRYKRRRSRTRSRDRSGRDRRRRSRSARSRTRSPRSRRRSSRDRGKEKERDKEREYDRERRRKGLPDLKKEHLSVCSTTLWVGHLSKLVQQEELSDTFGKYGDIVSIDMIHPRGCAFIVMNRRQDAYKAMSSLKNYKMQGRAITISWAAGKGVKSKEWKDYWDIELGVSYIPWEKVGPTSDLEALEEGGMFDEESIPQWLKDKILQLNKNKIKIDGVMMNPTGMFNMSDVDTSQPPPAAMMAPMVPPFAIGQRLMPPTMGMMPPNMVAGMPLPPPQMMMTGAPPGMVVSGMPPQMQMDKTVPPPNLNSVVNQTKPALSDVFLNHLASIAGHHQHQSFPHQIPMPPHIPPITQLQGMTTISSNDDHMDIEMEDDMVQHHQHPKSGGGDLGINMFNRPPPIISGQNNMPNNFDDRRDDRGGGGGRDRERDRSRDRRDRDRENHRDRERSRDYNNKDNRMSRWGGGDEGRSRDRGDRDRDRSKERLDKGIQDRLRNIAGDPMIPPDFTRREAPPSLLDLPLNDEWNGPPRNFMDDLRGPPMPPHIMRDGPMGQGNRPPLMRPDDMFDMRRDNDFNRMDDFDRRGGNNGGRDFFQQQNRFGPGNGPRGPPMGMGRGGPPPFGHRGGPMFMRGPRPGNFHERPAYMDREFSYEREERNDRGGGGPRGNRGMERRGGGLGGRQWRDNDDGNRKDRRSQSRGERESHSREPRERRFSNSSQWTDEDTNQELADSEKKTSDEICKKDENNTSISIVEPDCENLSSSNDFEDNGPPGGCFDSENSEKILNNNLEIIVPDPPVIRIERNEEENVGENIVEQTTPLYDEAPTESVEKTDEEEKTNSPAEK